MTSLPKSSIWDNFLCLRTNSLNMYGFTLGDIQYSHNFATPFPSNGILLTTSDYEGYLSRHRWFGTASLETLHWQPLLWPAWMATQVCYLIFQTNRSWDMRLSHCCSTYGEEKAFIAFHYLLWWFQTILKKANGLETPLPKG